MTLAACATGGAGGDNTAPPPAGFDASTSQFEGWARVQDGEIRLFAEQRDLQRAGSNACVSAALPRNAQRAAADLSGTKIRLHGRTARWSERTGAQTYDWQGYVPFAEPGTPGRASDGRGRAARGAVVLGSGFSAARSPGMTGG